jgi:hypothetical protein
MKEKIYLWIFLQGEFVKPAKGRKTNKRQSFPNIFANKRSWFGVVFRQAHSHTLSSGHWFDLGSKSTLIADIVEANLTILLIEEIIPRYGFTYSELCLSKIISWTSEVPEACRKEKHPFNNLIKEEKLNQVMNFIYKLNPPV